MPGGRDAEWPSPTITPPPGAEAADADSGVMVVPGIEVWRR